MTLEQGKLVAIAIRAASRGPMEELEQAQVSVEHGVSRDFRGKPGQRQVTVLSSEDWQAACEELGRQLPWTVRRANLLVEGLALHETTNSILRIGNVVLQVTGETDPCWRMDESSPGLQAVLTPHWRGGVCCRVITGGEIAPGAIVTQEGRRGGDVPAAT